MTKFLLLRTALYQMACNVAYARLTKLHNWRANFILRDMKRWTLLLMAVVLLSLTACRSNSDGSVEEVVPEGDPSQAARAFMTAFLNGNVTNCVNLSTEEARESVRALCQARADTQSTVDLQDTTFAVNDQDGLLAVVIMQGSYRETVTDPNNGNVVVTDIEDTTIVIYMEYQDDFWRFYDFG